jgi:hypothetical protein
MNEQDYIIAVQTLVNPKLSSLQRLDNFALGLVGESAELFEKISSPIPYTSPNKSLLEIIIDEAGDILWYSTNLCEDLKIYIIPSTIKLRPIPAVTNMLVSAGKVCDTIKKIVYHKHSITKHSSELLSELWKFKRNYNALLSHYYLSESEVRQYNFDKLSKRYPNLQFSSERSINREQ